MASTAIVFPTDGTVGALARRVIDKANEPITDKRLAGIYEDIGDAIESIWMSTLLASLSKHLKGPVTQVVSEQTTNIVSVPDPTTPITTGSTPGGNLPPHTIYISYILVTDSGSTTAISPIAIDVVNGNSVATASSPINPATQSIPDGVIGYHIFAGYQASGADQTQQTLTPLSFNQVWTEPPAGIFQPPNAPAPPSVNTTGDNIFAIKRIDVQNIDKTWTNWLPADLGSSFFTEFQHRVASATTWTPYVYDLIDNRQLEVRPSPGQSLSAVYFYVFKPRRPRFPQARIPFSSIACSGFLFNYAMSRFQLGLYEYESADRWNKYAEDERQRIVLQVSQGNWNQNSTVRPFMR